MSLKCKVLQNADREAFVKIIADGAGSFTLTRESLCYKEHDAQGQPIASSKFQQPFSYKPLRVSCRAIQWAGESDTKVVCKRNGEIFFTVCPECTGVVNLSGELGYVDNENDEYDLEFTSSGKTMQIWLQLRKNDYKSFVEETVFGVYDDPTKVDDPSA